MKRFLRLAIIGIGAVAQILFLYAGVHYFIEKYAWIEVALRVISVIVVTYIVNNSRHISVDMFWILLIVAFPVPGLIIFLFLGAGLISSKTVRRLYKSDKESRNYLVQEDCVMQEMQQKMSDIKGDFHYISKTAGYPFYRNSGYEYYGLGELGFPAMLEALEQASRFIFIEYFIIEDGYMWNQIHGVLKRKADEGVEIRVIYDDAGSIGTLSPAYPSQLEKEGIKCICFNRLNPLLNAVMNHRDHRKMLIIDGKTVFSGGINIADEYINRKSKYGCWKDNCIQVKGEAVWSYTVMFLASWNAIRKTDENFEVFKNQTSFGVYDGYVAPYGDTPFDGENIGQCVYANIINSAKDYIYICTPYLMIDNDLENSLILAAKKGVDVRILTPGIPDKKLVWRITRSYYGNLIDGGVKIYEYSSGFNHAKVFVSDDRVATVGTFNLDYRSLYLHFENGTYLCGSEKVLKIRNDFLSALRESRRMNKEDVKNNPVANIFIGFAKLFVSQM